MVGTRLKMFKKPNTYWLCQFFGWIFYVSINFIFFKLSNTTNLKDVLIYLTWLPVGIVITHFFRYLIVRYHVLKISIYKQIPLIIVTGIIQSVLFFFLNIAIAVMFGIVSYHFSLVAAASNILNLSVIFIFWSLIYFGFHFFINYKNTEIQNLKLEAASKEIELNKLKSQLNPHFMFNSMNSIRALIDEDPKKAKTAITQLSNILRNTLLMHKNKFITLNDELTLVEDYLALEHIRFEERLLYTLDIDEQTLTQLIPPMMIQTLVENGIKHGISKLPEGGQIYITCKLINNQLHITIINTGQLNHAVVSDLGFGLENTTNRLKYLYGDKALFKIENLNHEQVISKLIIIN